MNLLFTCGGTAGHINPAVALARLFQVRHPDCNVLFVGADRGMECRLVPKEGFQLRTVPVSNFHRGLSLQDMRHNFNTLRTLPLARRRADAILREFQPDLVVGTGGYASYPVVRQAARRGIPTAVHESNAVPGLTTKSLAAHVDKVMVGFEESRAYYPHPERVTVTGTPVRGDFFAHTKAEAKALLGICDRRPLLLSFWGSLGAGVMNGRMEDFIAAELADRTPFHHIHGAGGGFERLTAALADRGLTLPSEIQVRQYIYDMPLVMTAADLVLCRAGASTLAELTALGKPAILVPSPNVTNDHQTKNAQVLANAGEALLLPEAECGGPTLYTSAAALLRDPLRREQMAQALSKRDNSRGTEEIYRVLIELMA